MIRIHSVDFSFFIQLQCFFRHIRSQRIRALLCPEGAQRAGTGLSLIHISANMTTRETRASNLLECLLQLDLDVHASGELEAHQSLDRLVGRLQNVDQTLMGAGLTLLTACLLYPSRCV